MKAQQLLASLVVFAVLGTTQLKGQVQTSLIKRHQGVRAKENTDPANLPANAKNVSVSSRLIGMNFRAFNGAYYESMDSFSFTFSNNRGGDMNSEFLLFDYGYLWRYDPGTGTYYNFERAAQTFDINNNPVTQTYQLWDSASNSWKNEARSLNTYDSRNNILASIYQVWDISRANWRNVDQNIYTYNSLNQQTTEIYQSWNVSGDNWTNIYKYTLTYNFNSSILSQLYQNWDNSTNEWMNSELIQFTYDASNKVLSYLDQDWNNLSGTWGNDIRYSYTYDSYGYEVSSLFQTWDNPSNDWANNSLHLYTYDSGIMVGTKNLLYDLYEMWDSSAWVYYTKSAYTYNNTNDRIATMRQTWINASWQNTYLNTYTYDNNHNQLSYLQQLWDVGGNTFVNESLVERSFNKYNQLLSLTTNTWNPGGFWQPTTNDMQESFYYEEYGALTVKNVQSSGNLSIYPSPAINFVNIDLVWNNSQATVISIFDIMGRLYSQWELLNTDKYHNSLQVSDFPAGNYFIRIKGEKDQIVKQFAVLH